MRQMPYATVSADELSAGDAMYWEGALLALGVPTLDADDERPDRLADPVSFVLPYRAAQQRYLVHVQGCRTCSEEPIWSTGCEHGTHLAHLAADAMSRQDELAAQN